MRRFSGVRMYHGYVPGISRFQVFRDGIPQLLSSVPLRTGTAVHAQFCSCFVFVHGDAFFGLFCDHGPDFQGYQLM